MLKYRCCQCDLPAAEIHEVIFGNGVRQFAIDHYIQVPVCRYHHSIAHQQKATYQDKFYSLLGVDKHSVKRAMETKKHNLASRRYLDMVKKKLKHFLREYEL